MSYTERLVANASRLAGVVADRCVNVGGFDWNIVERAGADELGWLNSVFSGVDDRGMGLSSFARSFSNGSGGMKDGPFERWCLCRPSI